MNEEIKKRYVPCMGCWRKQENPPIIGMVGQGGDIFFTLWNGRAGTQMVSGSDFTITCQSCGSVVYSKKQTSAEVKGTTLEHIDIFGFFLNEDGGTIS